MHNVSAAYIVQKDKVIRNKQYLTYSVGVINQQAQANADISANTPDQRLSNNNIFGSAVRRFTYATFEQDFTKADGSSLVIPESTATNLTNGYVSDSLFSEGGQYLYIDFSACLEGTSTLDIKGLTIKFHDSCFPTAFNIITDTETYTVTDNAAAEWSTDHGFTDLTFMRIVPTAYRNDNLRLRVEHITFGIGLYFTNNKIKTATLKQYISPIADALPQIDFSITIDNSSGDFDTEDDQSALNYMEEGQTGEVYYGRELDDGTIETYKIATVRLDSWDADDKEAKFTSSDLLSFLDETYYKGAVSATDVSLYDLALDVLTDAGLTADQYYLDPYLREVFTKNPLPLAKHKECLQYIANAGRANLKIDKDGRISLVCAYLPDVTAAAYNYMTATRYGTAANIMDSTADNIRYATFDYNNIKADGSRYVCAASAGSFGGHKPCAVSTNYSSYGGVFGSAPSIRFTFESRCDIKGFEVIWGTDDYAYPVQAQLLTTVQADDGTETTLSYTHELDGSGTWVATTDLRNVIRMWIVITKMSAENVRARINYVSLGEVTNYEITYGEMTTAAKATNADRVKNVVVNYYSYSLEAEAAELANMTVQLSAGEQTVGPITWQDPAQITSYALVDPTTNAEVDGIDYAIDSSKSGCYAAFFTVSGAIAGAQMKLTVNGKKYVQTCASLSNALNADGTNKTLNNVLIDDNEQAAKVLEWISLYYRADKDYSIAYRGAPELEAHDTIFADMRGNNNPTMIKVYDTSIIFTGGLKGTIKARRQLDARSEDLDS